MHPRPPRLTPPRPALLPLCAALLGLLGLTACGEPDEGIDEEGWQHNDLAELSQPVGSCPNGGAYAPATPSFSAGVDAYAKYVGQSTCDPTAKPGVTAFMNFVLKTYPCTTSGGISRSCSVGGTSEHKEGRAWDWMLKAPHPAATHFLAWLLASDAAGNKHAMARRMGIMYMIWDRKMWRAYRPNDGWQPYTGSNPHTDHVHFSFSWDGANKKTSFWSGTTPPPNKAPTGKLEQASCAALGGWAQDPDEKTKAISVRLSVDGAAPVTLTAGDHRADLCSTLGSCNHGFRHPLSPRPAAGKTHQARAFALDSKTGAATELPGSPKTFSCPLPADAGTPDASPKPPADTGTPRADTKTPGDLPPTPTRDGTTPPVLPGAPATTLSGGCTTTPAQGTTSPPLLLALLLLAWASRKRR